MRCIRGAVRANKVRACNHWVACGPYVVVHRSARCKRKKEDWMARAISGACVLELSDFASREKNIVPARQKE